MRAEANGRIRFLNDAEEKRLRAVVAKLYPHRMPDLTIALGTGMRLSEQFSLTWDQSTSIETKLTRIIPRMAPEGLVL